MFKKSLLILLFILWAQNSSGTIELLFEIATKGWKLLQILNNAKSTKDTGTDIISLLTSTDDHAEVVQALRTINHKLDDITSYIKYKESHIELLIQQLPTELAIQSKKSELDEFIVTTDTLWEDLMSYIGSNSTDIFLDFAENILEELKFPLQHFRHVLTPLPDTLTESDQGLFMLIITGADQKRDILCNQGATSHHAVVRLFYKAMSTEIKAHTLLFVANLVKWNNSDAWREPLETRFRKQFNRTFEAFSESLKIARLPYIRSCDPNVWQIDKNYYGLYGYLQQTIYYLYGCHHNKYPSCKDLNEDKGTVFSEDGRNCSIIPLNEYAKCDGRPFGCTELDASFKDINTCAWDKKGPYRIRFLKHHYDIYGTDKESIAKDDLTCSPGNGYSKPGWKRLGNREEACSCQCPESRVKIMRQAMHSRIRDNCVIVGLRIHQVEDYIYIQIAEGKLEANGHISNHSWVPSTRNIYYYWSINPEPASAQKIQNLFFLADLQLRPGYALTGIQFTLMTIEKLSGFAVQTYGMKFDYKTGKLDNRTVSVPLQRGENHELKIPTKNPINMNTHERSSPKSDGYSHVYLQRSDLSDDYGQSTLPLLDGVPILTNPLSAIGGVGLFYKGYAESYAGFLSLRLYPVNFTYFMETFKESHDVNSILNWNN